VRPLPPLSVCPSTKSPKAYRLGQQELHAGALSLMTTLLLSPAHSAGSSDFLPCVQRAISDLDDGVSPADVVGAAAVHECVTVQMFDKCNDICSDALLKTFREDATVRVLRYRVSKRGLGK
jgi:hypothetical protein